MNNEVYINADYLGAVKQMPFFIKELQRVMPDTNIRVRVSDYIGSSASGALERDLIHEGIDSSRLTVTERPSYGSDTHSALIKFPTSFSDYSQSSRFFRFHIDPLKFEKRNLLDDDEIRELRNKYGIAPDAQVVLGGSLHNSDCSIFRNATEALLKERPNTKVVIACRESPRHFRNALQFEDIPFVEDSDGGFAHNPNTNYLIVREKGILDKLYSICDVAVLGDSLDVGSGQNPLEPAFYGKRTISGMGDGYFEDNAVAYKGLKKSGLLEVAEGEDGLTRELLRNVSDSELKTSQRKAAEFIDSRQGAAKVYAEIVRNAIEGNYGLSEKGFRKRMASFSDFEDYNFETKPTQEDNNE